MGRPSDTLLLLATNLGSIGPPNSTVRKNVYSTLNKIKDDFEKYPDIGLFLEYQQGRVYQGTVSKPKCYLFYKSWYILYPVRHSPPIFSNNF